MSFRCARGRRRRSRRGSPSASSQAPPQPPRHGGFSSEENIKADRNEQVSVQASRARPAGGSRPRPSGSRHPSRSPPRPRPKENDHALAARDQEPLQRARDMAAILECPDPFAGEATRPDQQRREAASSDSDRPITEHLAGRAIHGGDRNSKPPSGSDRPASAPFAVGNRPSQHELATPAQPRRSRGASDFRLPWAIRPPHGQEGL